MIRHRHEARLRSHVTRVFICTMFGALIAGPASATPLLLTFKGVIPTVQVFTQVETFVTGEDVVRTFDSVIFANVPVTGSFVFDSDVWSLTAPPSLPDSFLRTFTQTDPEGPANSVGIETPELLAGQIDVGAGVGVLPFSRHLIDNAPSTDAVSLPYAGSTTMTYVDGTDGLTLDPPFEFGDWFTFSLVNAFGWFDFDPLGGAPGEVFSEFESSRVDFGVFSGFAFPFVLQDLFPAGPPLAFSFLDPVPGSCGGLEFLDGLCSFGGFSVFSQVGVYTNDGAQVTFTIVGAESLLVTEAHLTAAVPEPASLALLGLGVAAWTVARRRRAM